MRSLLLCSTFLLVGTIHSKELFSRSTNSLSRSTEPCCDKDTLSCYDVEVDPESLLSDENISINGMELKFSNTIPPHGRAYKTEQGDEAVISYNKDTGNIFGSLKTNDGKSFALEKCGNGYIFEEFDLQAFSTEEEVEPEEFASKKIVRSMSPQTVNDRNEIVTYSVMIYYTPEFAAVTPNIRDFVDQVVAETNQGYINSQIPIRIKVFCTEEAAIDEKDTSAAVMLAALRNLKSSYEELRNSADAATLLTNDLGACGRGSTGTYATGTSVSVSKKSCALGYYSFGHELGHNLGATHNPESSTNPWFSYGHGHLIQPTGQKKWSGYRTILAYYSEGHNERVNYYSNPNVNFPGTGTPTGVADLSDNARVITDNRHAFAAVGDESGVCNDGSAPATTVAPTLEGCNENSMPTLKTVSTKKGVVNWNDCRELCNDNSECEYFIWKNAKAANDRICWQKKGEFKKKNGYISGERFCGSTATTTSSPSIEGCNKNRMPTLKKVSSKEGVATWSECRDLCNANSKCEYFVWKNADSVTDRVCQLRKVGFTKKRNYMSGGKFCEMSM